MSTLDFPAAPLDGQVFQAGNGTRYRYQTTPGLWATVDNDSSIVVGLVGIVTPQMYDAFPYSGIVSENFQAAMTAASGGTLLVSSGVWQLDRTINVPGNIVIEMHPGAVLDWTAAPLGTVGLLAQGSLGPLLPLAQDSHKIGPAKVWVGSTNSMPKSYALDERVTYQTISWRCVVPHTASNIQTFNVPAAALYHDAIVLGYWQRTSFKPAGGIYDIGPRDWIIVQDNARYDNVGLFSYCGESVRVLDVDATKGTITAQGTLHYDYLVSRNAFIRRMKPLANIRIQGGRLTFRDDVEVNNSIAIQLSCCSDAKIVGVEVEHVVACVSLVDCIDVESTGCNFHDGHGLSYGFAVSNNSQHIDLHHNVMTQVRHACTFSAQPDRSGPLHFRFSDNYVDCSLRYIASPTSPFGGGGDAIDTHAPCDYAEINNNIVLNASGVGIHTECAHSVVRGNTIDGASYGITCGNQTLIEGSADITGNTIKTVATAGMSLRSNANGATFSYINVQNNSVEDTGGIAYYITGQPDKRLKSVSFIGNRAMNSRSGTYMTYMSYLDAPEIGGYTSIQSLVGQVSLGIFNYVGGRITSMMVTQPPAATGTALFATNLNNVFLRAGRATNTGNGTISQPADPLLPGYQDGTYQVRCTAVAANGGTFTFYDIDGAALGTVPVGTAWGIFIAFTINDGSIDYALGDGWDFVVDGTTVATIKTASNVGDATLVVVANTVVADSMPEGTYRVTCTNATPPATWAVTDPLGFSVGTATTGVPFSVSGLQFTITAAGLPSAVGDTFTIRGTRAAQGLQIGGVTLNSPSPVSNRGFFFGVEGTTKRNFWSADNDVSQAVTLGAVTSGFGHIVESKARIEVRSETTSLTWTNFTNPTATVCSGSTVLLTGTITVNRTMTLTTSNATEGTTVRFKVQNGVAGFSWSIGGLISLIDGKWAQVTYSETLGAWVLTAGG